MTNRRDWLKLFSAGAIIAPAIGERVEARLIETPHVEIIQPPRIVGAFDVAKVTRATLTLYDAAGNNRSVEFKTPGTSYGDLGAAERFELALRGYDCYSPQSYNVRFRIDS